jgi:class 3 adenylate cyclase
MRVVPFGGVREGRASGTVTVLFTDLVGSTELMSRLGAEAFDRLRQAHFAALRQAIDRHGGEEVKNTGDGLMVVFGSVADAIRAAVAMQQATDRQARSGPAPVGIRIGLSVGDVTFEDGDVFGPPVVEAARLVAVADPGKILTTGIARALAGGRTDIEFVDLGLVDLKGLSDRLPVCEVLWQPTGPSIPMPALRTDIGRVFVGRDGEVERLRQLWKEAVAGELRVALLAGEPGVGKTRLSAEVAAAAHSEGGLVLAGRCDEDLGVPYQPFVEALHHFVDHTPPDDLLGGLGRYGGELVRLVPDLAGRVPELQAPLRSDPETERYRLFDAVAAWLAAASADQPLLVVLDDLQWAAKPTLLLLRHVVRSPDATRLLVLGTYRDTELGHDHPLVELLADLRRQTGVERLSLSGWDQAAVATFMSQVAGHEMDDEGLALARAIHTETEGNPFFVRELLRHLTETGAIEQRDGRWGASLPIEEVGIPEGVREVVGRRLARLSGEANRALRVAAVVGTEFELPVVQAAGNLDEEDLLSALDQATEARLVMEAHGPRYRFAHALVRDTLYSELSAPRRVAAHRKVAEAIEALHAGALDDHLPALAHHWARASAPAAETSKAVDYATRAGDRALAQLAHDEAAAYYGQALELLGVAPGPPDEARRLELLISLGEAQRRAGDRVYGATLLAAAHLAQQQGDAEALVRAALANSRGTPGMVGTVDADRVTVLQAALDAIGKDDSHARARLLATLGLELVWGADLDRRTRYSDEALAIARRLGDPAPLAHVLICRFYTTAAPGTVSARLADTAELLSVSERLEDPATRCRAYHLRARVAGEVADLEEAHRCIAAYERLAGELGQPILNWIGLWYRTGPVLASGEIPEAERLAGRILEAGQRIGQDASPYWAIHLFDVRRDQGRLAEFEADFTVVARDFPGLTFLRAYLALLLCEIDEDARARPIFEEFAADFGALPLNVAWARAMAALAEVCAHLGDITRAAELSTMLAPYADQLAAVAGTLGGSLAHYLGMLAGTRSRFDEAEAYFASAAGTHDRMKAPAWLARTRLEWARMLLTRRQPGDIDRARDLLGQALETARELGLGNVERRAVELLQGG